MQKITRALGTKAYAAIITTLTLFVSNFCYAETGVKECTVNRGAAPHPSCQDPCWLSCYDLAASTGYVWKGDGHFRDTYAKGIENIITLDTTWWMFRNYGLSLKGSYWAANGTVIGTQESTSIWQVPLALSLKGRIGSRFQAYGSIGVDLILTRESNFLGVANETGWGGEVEAGLNYYIYKQFYITAAIRYIYCRKYITAVQDRADLGGTDLRGGLGVSF